MSDGLPQLIGLRADRKEGAESMRRWTKCIGGSMLPCTSSEIEAIFRTERQMYKVTGIGMSLFFIAVGAVLAWAIDVEEATNGGTRGVDWNMVGLIVFLIGVAGLLITLIATFAVQGRERTTVIERGTVEPIRDRIIER